jgi:ribosome biogenesis GTPase / thiamine phosphate phosphatase
MSQRRLTEQQRRRIDQIQARRLAHHALQTDDCLLAASGEPQAGRVITRHGRNLIIEDPTGRLLPCLFRQNLGPLVCGDRILWQPAGPAQGVVTALEERRSLLIRPNHGGQERPLAANIDRMILVLAPQPPPQRYLLDQYLVSAELLGIEALICLNKTDLLDPDGMTAFDREFGDYPRIGYPLLKVSSRTQQGLLPLLQAVRGRTAILLGQSGVGKSSLAANLLPDREIQTGRLSAVTGKGCHTTSSTTLYHLPEGGELIDSPGVRSFRPSVGQLTDLEQGFREFADYLGKCRFSNCAHRQEPGCALLEAVASGSLDPRRLENFLHMAGQLQRLSGP